MGVGDVVVRFDEMDGLAWREFITQFEAIPQWLSPAFEYNLTEDMVYRLIKPRLPNEPPRTMDTNIFAPKGLGKSYLLLELKEYHHNYFGEEFDWSTFFMSPTQFLMGTEKCSEDDISNKFLAIDEPKVKERGEGSGALWDRFMNTRATIRPRRSVIAQASERYVSTHPNIVIKPVYLDEKNEGLMSLVLNPTMTACYGSMFSGPHSKKVSKQYDKKRLTFERKVREDKSEVREYWEPIALELIEKYGYLEKMSEIAVYNTDKTEWAQDKQLAKPTRPSFMNQSGELSERRIVQDARYEKKLSSTEYQFLAGLVLDLLKR